MTIQKLKKQGNYHEDQLYSVIVNSRGKPDLLAVRIYSYLKGWFQSNRNSSLKKDNKLYIREYGFRTSYEELAKKHYCSKELVRQKIVLLEQIGLISRSFRIEYDHCGIRKNNVLHLLLWKETPYFEFEYGLDKTSTFLSNLDKETWEVIQENPYLSDKSTNTPPSKKLEIALPRKTREPLQEDLDIIYSNTTLNNTLAITDLTDLPTRTYAHTHTHAHEEQLLNQDQKDQFQNVSLLQDQGECVNIEAKVENVPTNETVMVGKMNECVEQSADTSNSFIGDLVRDPDLDFDYRSVTASDGTQYMAPIRRVEEVKCYNLKDMAKEYFAKFQAQREQNNNQEPIKGEDTSLSELNEEIQKPEDIKPVTNETNSVHEATADKTSNEDIITTSPAVTSSTDNVENPRKEALWMTIEEMREAMARDKAIAKAKQEVVANNQSPKQPQSTTSTKPVTETTSTQTSAVIVSHRPYKNRHLKDCVFTPEIYDAIRVKSNKPHFSNDRIFAVARNIVANNPETKIWGGKTQLINYMVKAINNEKEYTLEEIGESVAEAQRQRAEEERYQAENNIILWL